MKKTMSEFKEFAIKGNMLDMAVGIVIGAAFGKIINSFVDDIIMPFAGMLTGGLDFSSLAITLRKATDSAPALTLNYGMFINNVVTFVIISFSLFIIIKQINRFRKEEKKKEKTPQDIVLLKEIRDTLKQMR